MVVLDKLPACQVDGRAALLEARGVRLVYLLPYLPDVNRIGFAFRQRKNDTTPDRPAPAEPFEEAMQQATAGMWGKDAQNWFAHCGYRVH
jgi:hypothetical protein